MIKWLRTTHPPLPQCQFPPLDVIQSLWKNVTIEGNRGKRTGDLLILSATSWESAVLPKQEECFYKMIQIPLVRKDGERPPRNGTIYQERGITFQSLVGKPRRLSPIRRSVPGRLTLCPRLSPSRVEVGSPSRSSNLPYAHMVLKR